MTQAAFQALLQRYLKGECTAAEAQQVEAWYAALHRGQPTKAHAEEPLASRRPQPALRLGRGQRRRWGAVALLVLSLSAGLGWRLHTHRSPAPLAWETRRNPAGPVQQLTLPDGSRVGLRAGSTLRYRAGLAGPRREVYLTGEAFFDVTANPARPFQVYTKSLVTTVLGTAFLVRAWAGQSAALVRVQRGKVRVSARTPAVATFANREANPASVVLLPNQQAVALGAVPGRGPQLRKTLADQPVALAASQQLFINEPVARVLSTLSKDYGVAIAYDPAVLQACTVNLAFTTETLYQRLDLLCQALDASYERTDERLVFHSAGCTRR